jgi:hypothetical protein
MIEVGEYEFQKYQAHKSMMKVIFIYVIIILLFSVLIQINLLPSGLGTILVALAFIACLVTVIKRLSDMYSRSNMNYNQFKFSKPSLEGSTEDIGETVWEYDKRAFGKMWKNTKAATSSAQEYVSQKFASSLGNDSTMLGAKDTVDPTQPGMHDDITDMIG